MRTDPQLRPPEPLVAESRSPVPPPPTAAAGRCPADRGDATRPRWARPAAAALLIATAAAYLYNLSASGYANSFYAAAVEAGAKSWKAMFFGSLDSSSFITVDKPPASLWVMDLSARIFGFSTWSLLVPEVLEGVAAVALLYLTVRRWSGAAAGLAAGALLAVTPVAALMFRFDNPDALLVLCLVAAAYALTRALEKAGTGWAVAAGGFIGIAFLAKMMQAFTVVPAFALVYLVAAPASLRRRVAQVLASGVAVVIAAGWWVAIVALLPAADRPFIDGSPDNSIFNLIFVYNGFSRLDSGTGGPGSSFSGATGPLRLFNDLMGTQASWLLPAALIGLVAGLWLRRRAPRTDRTRAALLLWGGWLLVTGAVFSLSSGVIHTYYTVALTPAIAALIAIAGRQLWAERDRPAARMVAAGTVATTGAWAYALLDRTPTWLPWLRAVVAGTTVLAAAGLLALPLLARYGRRLTVAVLALGIVATLAGPVAFAASTVNTGHSGSLPVAGPTAAQTGAGPGGAGPGGARLGGAPLGGAGRLGAGRTGGAGATGGPPGGPGGPGGPGAFGPPGSAAGPGRSGSRPGGAGGGPGGTTHVARALVTALESGASRYRWVAATFGSQEAATYELATAGDPVMAIGGFNGNGGNLTLAQFEAYVAKGDIHYFIATAAGGPGGAAGGTGGPGGGAGNSDTAITAWVEAHFKATTVGSQTVYDLTRSTG